MKSEILVDAAASADIALQDEPTVHQGGATPSEVQTMKQLLALSAFALVTLVQTEALGQTATTNAGTLRSYMAPAEITKLDWELLQFNVLWTGSFSTSAGSYFTSFPVVFDYRAYRFRTFVGISERRDHQDPDPWSSLPRLRKEAQLREVVEHLVHLLQTNFPELKARPELLLIEFRSKPGGAAFVSAARYENGALSIFE